MTDCICVKRGDGQEGCGLCNETGKRPAPGVTITLGYSKVYNGLHLQKWENHGLSEGTYRLVVVEDGE